MTNLSAMTVNSLISNLVGLKGFKIIKIWIGDIMVTCNSTDKINKIKINPDSHQAYISNSQNINI